ncbi:MAG TPA: ABC transporter permease [Mycobacteriales bacterium]|nr:ABC transporter permease [Mycobacteriales bacterium]
MPPDARPGTLPATDAATAAATTEPREDERYDERAAGRLPDSDPDPDLERELESLERGLDALEVEGRSAGRRRWRRLGRVLAPVLAAGVVLLVWQAAVWLEVKPRFLLPSPLDVGDSLVAQWQAGALQRAAWLSVSRGMLGFAASVAIGTPLGLLVARVPAVRAAIAPMLSGLQSLPSVAWVPAGIVWFGLSPGTIYFVVLLGAVPSIANGTVSGLDQVPPLYHRVGRVLGARGLRAAWHIQLPAALPGYVGGLKQGWAFAWRSLMAAELITQSPRLGTGLGQLLDSGRQLSDVSLVFGMIIVILVVGVAVDRLIFAPLERSVLGRRGLRGG